MTTTYTIVGWCPDCEAYVVPYKPGESCPGDGWDLGEHPSKRLHKRRMYICPIDYCDGLGFFELAGWREHMELEHSEEDA